jgi:tetratricopeptide (TPR) repeat protein
VPHLIVKRDARVDREADFGPAGLRIGRDPGNDIVLDDPDHGVSRFHAEIRRDQAGYTVVDLNSRNGTWVDGERITATPLLPGTTVAIGSYTLECEAETDAPQSAQTTTASEYTVFAPAGITPGGGAPVGGAAGPRVPPHAPPAMLPRGPVSPRRSQALLFAGTAIVVGCVLGAAFYMGSWTRSREGPPPSNVTTSVESPERDVGPRLSEAHRLLDAGDPAAALHELDAVFAIDATNREATALRAEAQAALAKIPEHPEPPDPGPVVNAPHGKSDRPPRAVAAGDPGPIPRRPGESQADWQARMQRIEDRYQSAKAAISAEDTVSALARLQALERDQPGYLDVPALIARSRDHAKAQARESVDAGERAEQAGNWAAALQAYTRARQLDSSVNLDDRMSRVQEEMVKRGTDAYHRARQLDALGRTADAIAAYERAVALLPATNEQQQEAMKRLQILKSKP